MSILVADEAWLATALLHREHPDAEDFSLDEIRDRARREFHDNRPGVWQHIVSHCVASNRPNPAQYRMLHGSARGRRRLYRPGDPVHPDRKGKIYPEKRDIPERYRNLVDWYLSDYSKPAPGSRVQQRSGLAGVCRIDPGLRSPRRCRRPSAIANEWIRMSGRLLVDTNIVIALFAGEPAAIDRLEQRPELFLCVPVLGELRYGALASSRVEENLARLDGFSRRVLLLPCDSGTAVKYSAIRFALRKKGTPIPENDVWIAAIAQQYGLTLLSRDSHFREIDGLDVETL